MKKYIVIGAMLATGLVQADIANVVTQARIAGGTAVDYNTGGSGHIDIKEGGGQYTRYAVLKVDLSAIGAGQTVTSANLDMLIKNSSAGGGNFQLFGVVDSAANGWDWNTDMTWNEAAAQGMWTATEDLATQGLLDAKLVDLGSTAFAGGGSPYSYDVAASGAALVGLMNADTDGMLTLFAAVDANETVGVRDPLTETTITYTVIPEPATLGLVGMAALGLFGFRRFSGSNS